ncbi:hypothetical protein MLGJGCBP_02314 [Rhodococcus sp. T7]|nr:hypothetical protein MLGJGCBP_02314 [Rhodococcus sp. T7]
MPHHHPRRPTRRGPTPQRRTPTPHSGWAPPRTPLKHRPLFGTPSRGLFLGMSPFPSLTPSLSVNGLSVSASAAPRAPRRAGRSTPDWCSETMCQSSTEDWSRLQQWNCDRCKHVPTSGERHTCRDDPATGTGCTKLSPAATRRTPLSPRAAGGETPSRVHKVGGKVVRRRQGCPCRWVQDRSLAHRHIRTYEELRRVARWAAGVDAGREAHAITSWIGGAGHARRPSRIPAIVDAIQSSSARAVWSA